MVFSNIVWLKGVEYFIGETTLAPLLPTTSVFCCQTNIIPYDIPNIAYVVTVTLCLCLMLYSPMLPKLTLGKEQQSSSSIILFSLLQHTTVPLAKTSIIRTLPMAYQFIQHTLVWSHLETPKSEMTMPFHRRNPQFDLGLIY